MFGSLTPNSADISSLIRFSEKKTSPSGQDYLEPPQCGGIIWEEQGLPRWQKLSKAMGMPVGKDYGDGSFYVVTPSTTAADMQAQYRAGTGTQGFEEALRAAWAIMEASKGGA